MDEFEIRLFGEFKVVCGGAAVGPTAPKARALLACLASAPNQVVGTERLTEAIWGESPPESAGNALQVYVSQWRRVLREVSAPAGVRSSLGGYSLRLDPSCIDLARLELLAESGRSHLLVGEPDRAARALGAAVDLCRGGFLQGLEEAPIRMWLEPHVTQLERAVRLGQAQAKIQLGEAEGCLPGLRRLASEEPDSEHVVVTLMHALYLSGRQRDALAVSEAFRKSLRSFGLEPSSGLRDLEHRILVHDPSLVPTPVRTLGSDLPRPARPFVGDRSVVDQVALLVGEASRRLVTLVGFAGVGKTRIALEVAHIVRFDRRRPVVFVPLDEVGNESDLLRAVAKGLGVTDDIGKRRAEETLLALRDLGPLLVLDRAEHLFPKIQDAISQLLRVPGSTNVLVTSRTALDLPGEHVVPIESPRSLRRPDEDPVDVPAVVFLSEFMHPDALVEEELEFALELCRRLDGNPLALEIAAARARRLGIADVVLGLRLDPGFLENSRTRGASASRGIEAAVQWSFSLLSSMSQRALLAMAQFPGGFEVGHLRAVLPELDGGQALDIVEELLAHHLVARAPQRQPIRCVYPQLVVDFCLPRVPEELRNEYWRRYSSWILSTLRGLATGSPRTARRYRELAEEHQNVRRLASLTTTQPSVSDLSSLCLAIYEWWMYTGSRQELFEWIEHALTEHRSSQGDRRLLRLLAGRVAAQLGDYSMSDRHLLGALGIYSGFDSTDVSARVALAENRALVGDLEAAHASMIGLETSEPVGGDEALRVRLLLARAIVEQLKGKPKQSLTLLKEVRRLPILLDWLDARVKTEVVLADILRDLGSLSEGESQLMSLTVEIERTQSSELRELVFGMLATLRALSGDRLGTIFFGVESLSAMTGESRDIETVLRTVLALERVGISGLDALARRAAELRELFLVCFPTPQVLVNELRVLRFPPLEQLPERGIPQGWVALTDELLYELRRAVATGSAR